MKHLNTYESFGAGLGIDIEDDLYSNAMDRDNWKELSDYLGKIFGTKDNLLPEFIPKTKNDRGPDNIRYFGKKSLWIRFTYDTELKSVSFQRYLLNNFPEGSDNIKGMVRNLKEIIRLYIESIYKFKVESIKFVNSVNPSLSVRRIRR